jgi:putative ABC transport system permease protein
MKVGESIRISWRAITGHKLRSTLTTLGVIIGIGSVIVFMVLGGGFEANLLGDIESENEPLMNVNTQTNPDGGFGIQTVQSPIYTQSDIDAIRDIEGVEYVSPDGDLPAVQLRRGDDTLTGGFGVEASNGQNLDNDLNEMVEGELFSAADEAVVNERATRLFESNISVGDDLTISFQDGSKTNFTVTGIVDDDIGGPNPPNVYVPLDHYNLSIETPDGREELAFSSMVIGAESIENIDAVKDDVSEYFETESDAQQLKEDEHVIQVQTIADVIDQFSSIIGQLTGFIGGIAAISLFVGSIGIANIMIVSVTERTREIGIMKAVGARKRDIVQLFLVESVILGAIGAIFGVLAGLGVGYLAVSLFGWPMVYPLNWIIIAVLVGVVVGILSGLYPAWRAAKVDPIQALRRE